MHYKQLHYCVYQADDICRHTLYYACTATVVTCCQSRGILTQCLPFRILISEVEHEL